MRRNIFDKLEIVDLSWVLNYGLHKTKKEFCRYYNIHPSTLDRWRKLERTERTWLEARDCFLGPGIFFELEECHPNHFQIRREEEKRLLGIKGITLSNWYMYEEII